MKPEQMIEALQAVASQNGVEVRYESLAAGGVHTGGGVCKVRGAWWIIIDKKSSPAERVAILTDALAGMELSDVAMPPKIKELIEQRRQARASAG